MRKPRVTKLPKVSADHVAQNLKRGMGKDAAFKLARGLARNLNEIGAEDFNHEFFAIKDLAKHRNFWTHVQNILAK